MRVNFLPSLLQTSLLFHNLFSHYNVHGFESASRHPPESRPGRFFALPPPNLLPISHFLCHYNVHRFKSASRHPPTLETGPISHHPLPKPLPILHPFLTKRPARTQRVQALPGQGTQEPRGQGHTLTSAHPPPQLPLPSSTTLAPLKPPSLSPHATPAPPQASEPPSDPPTTPAPPQAPKLPSLTHHPGSPPSSSFIICHSPSQFPPSQAKPSLRCASIAGEEPP